MPPLRTALAALVACVLLLAPAAHARTLAEARALGSFSICAHPDALPFAREKGSVRGFQVDLGEALARAMGLGFEAKWIIPSYRARLVDCDAKMDFIVQGFEDESKVRLSRPYARGGVALAIGAGHQDFRDFRTVVPGKKIGTMVNSMPSVILQKRGWFTSPYAFEDDMIEDLENNEIAAGAISLNKIQWYLKLNPSSRIRFAHAYEGEEDMSWTLAVGLRRADQPMVDAVNEALQRLMDDGTVEAIYARYGIAWRRP